MTLDWPLIQLGYNNSDVLLFIAHVFYINCQKYLETDLVKQARNIVIHSLCKMEQPQDNMVDQKLLLAGELLKVREKHPPYNIIFIQPLSPTG